MKKFLIFLVVLILLGGTGFFLGWTQLTVPPGAYGVMRSKFYGIDPEVIRDGEFRWIWYKLIPTNVDIKTYTLKQVNRSVRGSGSLPSGDVYAALAGIDADFSWEISGDFSFSFRASGLPGLVERENLSGQDDLDALEQRYAGRVEAFIADRMRGIAADETKAAALPAASYPELESAVAEAFPEIEQFNCRFRTIRYPDYTLYRSVRTLYNEYISRQEAVLGADLTGNAESRIASRFRFDELARYGELLTKYPVLLEYLALEKDLMSRTVISAAPVSPGGPAE
jgi:hypothetical protein